MNYYRRNWNWSRKTKWIQKKFINKNWFGIGVEWRNCKELEQELELT